MKKRIYILGVNGMLGHTLYYYLKALKKYELITTSRDVVTEKDNTHLIEADYIIDIEEDLQLLELKDNIELQKPDIIINCIGLLIAACEKFPDRAIYINSYFPHYLEKITKNTKTKIIQISTDCFVSSTLILTAKGYKEIAKIKVGEKVVTHKGELRKVYKTLSRFETHSIYRIKVMGCDEIKCTQNHPFYTISHKAREKVNLDSIEWKRARELHTGDLIAIPKLKNIGIVSKYFKTKVRYNKFFENKYYWFMPIKEIKKESYIGKVYNLEVEEHHSYLINGGLSAHNCVFSGKKKNGGYLETDIPDGTDFYARSKFLGELQNNKDLTIRTSFIGKELKKTGIGLFDWFMQQTKDIKGYSKVYWNGITSLELARHIDKLINLNITGLYHLVSDMKISKYDLLLSIQKIWGKPDIAVIPDEKIVYDKSLINNRKKEYDPKIPCYFKQLEELRYYISKNEI